MGKKITMREKREENSFEVGKRVSGKRGNIKSDKIREKDRERKERRRERETGRERRKRWKQ